MKWTSELLHEGSEEWKPWTVGSLEEVLEDVIDFRYGHLGHNVVKVRLTCEKETS